MAGCRCCSSEQHLREISREQTPENRDVAFLAGGKSCKTCGAGWVSRELVRRGAEQRQREPVGIRPWMGEPLQ